MKRKLNQHLILKQNRQHAMYLFNRMRQKNNETIIEYAVKLKVQGESCEFRHNREERILEQLLKTTEDSEMIRKAIQKQ